MPASAALPPPPLRCLVRSATTQRWHITAAPCICPLLLPLLVAAPPAARRRLLLQPPQLLRLILHQPQELAHAGEITGGCVDGVCEGGGGACSTVYSVFARRVYIRNEPGALTALALPCGEDC
jgi:hypothetical protein